MVKFLFFVFSLVLSLSVSAAERISCSTSDNRIIAYGVAGGAGISITKLEVEGLGLKKINSQFSDREVFLDDKTFNFRITSEPGKNELLVLKSSVVESGNFPEIGFKEYIGTVRYYDKNKPIERAIICQVAY